MQPIVVVALLALAAAAALAQGGAQAEGEPAPDLAALIECRASGVPDYNRLAFALTGDDRAATLAQLGMTPVVSGNPLLETYRLTRPVTVFGRRAGLIAFNSAGIFALLDEADPHPLAKQLGVTPALDRPGKYLADKVLVATDERDGDQTFHTRIALNVSTVDSHPGKTLAGCSYRIDVD